MQQNIKKLTGKVLNILWGIGAKHALYREDGKWYHQLKSFPGVLFDANGYIVFETQQQYQACEHLRIQKDLHVPNGISSIPGYVHISESSKMQNFSHQLKEQHYEKRSSSSKGKAPKQKPPQLSENSSIPEGKLKPKRKPQQINRTIRDTKIALYVKLIHLYSCQLCGDRIELSSDEFYAEAHHIRPLAEKHSGPDVIENVICVCPKCHVLLDYGAIRIEKENLSLVSGHSLSEDYIEYHNFNIYQRVL
jgi:5-methylcytosine-specific restriction protein A